MKEYAFDVIVNEVPYTVSLALDADDHWDAEEQIMETICNRYSRDPDDQKALMKQAVNQFAKQFLKALNRGAIDDVREA